MTTRLSPADRAREWAVRAVQWGPARVTLKRGAHVYGAGRGFVLDKRGTVPEIANIYTASAPKAGSQWMRALFDHPVVKAHTGLFTVPQMNYKLHPERGFPHGVYVPGLYLSYDDYKRIPHTMEHRCIYMFRDPRDLVISGYFSAVKTHQDTYDEDVEAVRDEIRGMSFDDGLLHLINYSRPVLEDMTTWEGVDDPNVLTFQLEEVSADPRPAVLQMLEHCGIDLSPAELDTVLAETSREALQAKDLARREPGAESHYRVDRKGWRELFQPVHHEAIEAIVPGFVTRLGYDA